MSRTDPFGQHGVTPVSSKAEIKISVDRVEGRDVYLTVHASAPGLPVIKICENQLREGDTLVLKNLHIQLTIHSD